MDTLQRSSEPVRRFCGLVGALGDGQPTYNSNATNLCTPNPTVFPPKGCMRSEIFCCRFSLSCLARIDSMGLACTYTGSDDFCEFGLGLRYAGLGYDASLDRVFSISNPGEPSPTFLLWLFRQRHPLLHSSAMVYHKKSRTITCVEFAELEEPGGHPVSLDSSFRGSQKLLTGDPEPHNALMNRSDWQVRCRRRPQFAVEIKV